MSSPDAVVPVGNNDLWAIIADPPLLTIIPLLREHLIYVRARRLGTRVLRRGGPVDLKNMREVRKKVAFGEANEVHFELLRPNG
jgi:hypothetical protein